MPADESDESDVTHVLDELEARLILSASECLAIAPTASLADVGRAFAELAARLHPCRFALLSPDVQARALRLLRTLRPVYFQAVLERTAVTWEDDLRDRALDDDTDEMATLRLRWARRTPAA